MTERWKNYIEGGIDAAGGPIPFALTQWTFLLPVFATMHRTIPNGAKVLDVGCGAAIFTALLAHHGFDIVGIDEDSDIVAYAQEMVEYFRSPARVEQGDVFDLSSYYGKFDLVYSLGVLEHYEADVTVDLIREQARCARFVLVSVPTRFTCYAAPVTDERLYRRKQVSDLIRRAGLQVRESFVYGDVPTRFALNLERFLPKLLHRGIRYFLSYGMGICCLGEYTSQA